MWLNSSQVSGAYYLNGTFDLPSLRNFILFFTDKSRKFYLALFTVRNVWATSAVFIRDAPHDMKYYLPLEPPSVTSDVA